jgi:4-amino-4-deoxy-L-arabinose transferase-like glycosyltransferase
VVLAVSALKLGDFELLDSSANTQRNSFAPGSTAKESELTVIADSRYASPMNTAPLPRTPLAWLPHIWQRVLFTGPSATDSAVRSLSIAILVILPGLLLYPTLGFRLLEPDEGRYAQIPKEMLVRGEWVVPTLQGEPYLDKPPLMYWLIKIAYLSFGVNESAARIVPALCVHLTILAVYFIGRRSVGERAAFWAAVLLTIAPGYTAVARLLLLDGLLTLCVTVSVLAGYEAVRTGQLKPSWWMLSAIGSGLGFLTKGPISEILLFPPLVAASWLGGSLARVSLVRIVQFAAVVIGINIPWYVAIYLREPVFLKYFFWEHNVMRFVQPFDHLQPVWYYVPIIVAGFLPGTILFAVYLWRLLVSQQSRPFSAANGFWLLSGGWCMLFFSVSGSKLPTYILPAYPFLCLALGEFVANTDWRSRIVTKSLVAGMAVILAGFIHVGLPWYAEARSPMTADAIVMQYVDAEIPVATYPRNCDSVAYYTDRADFRRVRSKDVNDLMVAMHHRPRTVVLFTHRHSFAAFSEAMPESLAVIEHVSLKRPATGILGAIAGDAPWGLADIAVIGPAGVSRAQRE